MNKILAFTFIGLTALWRISAAQDIYFPPATGTAWDTIAPASLGWCKPQIDSLYNYLQARNTKGFIVLKDGKIVLEKYFGTFTRDSVNEWASAGKSLTAMLTGIAQEQRFISLNDTVSNVLGNGWTSCTVAQERQITICHLLTMTSGLNDNPGGSCGNDDVTSACLQYLVAPGTRWAYHTGPYRKMEDVIATAAGVTYNSFTQTRIKNKIGMSGAWVSYIYFSRVRDAARFGLLALNKGVWASDTLLRDTAYFNAMTHTSQSFNLSYGYLWWLNGQPSYMAPGLQTVFTKPFFSNAPADMIAALGKGDQKIYVVPSRNMVVVRLGDSAYGSAAAFSPFDNELWGYLEQLSCSTTSASSLNTSRENGVSFSIHSNPLNTEMNIQTASVAHSQTEILNLRGNVLIRVHAQNKIDISNLSNGLYIVTFRQGRTIQTQKIVKH